MSREMKHSGIPWIGEIPRKWRLSRYKFFATSRMGETILSEDTKECGIPVYSATQDGKIFGYVETPKVLLHKGDFVIPARGNSIGCISVVKEEVATCTQTTICSYNIRNINSSFLYYCGWGLKDEWFKFDGSAIPQITVSQVNNNLLPLPSIEEQQKIASFLDRKCAEIDEMIALQEKIVEELKAYKQSVITEVVTKGLNPDVPMKDSGIEWIGEIPEHWSIDKIIRSFGLIGSGTTPKSTDEDNFIGNIRWIQSGDINGGVMTECKNRISEKTLHTTSALKIYNPPFIIIAMYGASVGNTSISMIDGCVNQACCVLSESYLNLEYSFNVIKSCKDFWIRKAVGGGQPNISQDTIKSTWVPIPPKEEQKQIASYLNTKCTEIDNLISIKLSKIDSLKEYKKSIIYEYVTGKKEVEA